MIITITIQKKNANYNLKKKYVDFLIKNCNFWIKKIEYSDSKKKVEILTLSGTQKKYIDFLDLK